MPNKTYSQLTEQDRKNILAAYADARRDTNREHATALAAFNGLRLTEKEWNSKRGADSWAAAVALLFFHGKL